jgi:anthranilate phosphoribosyltransferase
MIQEAIAKLVDGQNLSADEAEGVMNALMSGSATQAQIGAYLTALRIKGETVDEITGSVRVMREKVLKVSTRHEKLVDVVGTGGDKSGSFNISTTAAFVVAGAGAVVAKHGNRAMSSKSGSGDVLSSLGVSVGLTPEQVGHCIDEVGIGFMFAPTHHPAMKSVAGPRRELAFRTVFNVLGPLTNPAGAKHQLLGVFDARLTETLARVLGDLGSAHVWVVSGPGGLDELSTTGVNRVSELHRGDVRTGELDTRRYGLAPTTLADIEGGSPDFNAAITRSVLEGHATPARTDVVALNAGAALVAADLAGDLAHGIELARKSIASGAALDKLEALIAKSQAFATPEN